MAAPTPSCPRCGYDLSGAIASWWDTCPLATTCSECGLSFELRLVLNDRLREQARFFEAAGSHLARALITTTRAALRPWSFWRWVSMEYPPHPARMLAGPVLGSLLIATGLTAAAFVLMTIQVLVERAIRSGPLWAGYSVSDGLESELIRFLMPWSYERQNGTIFGMVVLGLLIQALMPLVFVLLPQTLRRAKVRPRHIARAAAWSLIGTVVSMGGVQFFMTLLSTFLWAVDRVVPRPSPFTPSGPAQFFAEVLGLLEQRLDLLLLGSLSLWMLLWWGFAVGRYLKLPRPWLITSVMFTIAALASILLCMLDRDLRYAVGLRL